MVDLYSHILVAIAVFVSTNIDDIFLLAAFFSDPKLNRKSVIYGQFLGIGVLVFASCLAAWFAVALPDGWVSLLGCVPLYLGLRQLLALSKSKSDDEEDIAAVSEEHAIERRLHSQILSIAGVTIANGGDNLGVYIPLFVTSAAWIPLFAAVFAVMTALWCWVGFAIVNNRILGERIRRYGHKVLPFVLILLGLHILSGATVLL